MRTLLIILTMQLVSVAKIMLAYLGITDFGWYFNFMNIVLFAVYAVILGMAFILFLKEQFDVKNVCSRKRKERFPK